MGGSVAVAGLFGRTPLWVVCVVVTALAAVVTMRFGERSAVVRFGDWASYRWGYAARARARARVPAVRDVVISGGVCGVREAGAALVAMIQLAPDLDLPTVVGDSVAFTEDTLSVRTALDLLDHFGVEVDIDIVTTGQRVRSVGSYGMLYHQLIGSQPVVGNRLTWLVVRLDQERNFKLLARRGPYAETAPKALSAAAHRIAGRLRERGVAAHALPAAHLREATLLLHAGVDLAGLRENRRDLLSRTGKRYVTSYGVAPGALGPVTLSECWTAAADHTTITLSLSRRRSVDPQLRAMVRYVGPRFPEPPVAGLCVLVGQQSDALLASLPLGGSGAGVQAPVVAADQIPIDDLKLPIGPSGQILGALAGRPSHALALPLFDPARFNPRRRVVDVRAQLSVVQQIVLRAAAVGAQVEVHTTRPHKWLQLVTAFGDQRTLRLAGDLPDEPATIAVFDQMPPTATNANTLITVADPGAGVRAEANLSIDQVGPAEVDVSIPMRTVRVELIQATGESRYLDVSEPVSRPSATTTGR